MSQPMSSAACQVTTVTDVAPAIVPSTAASARRVPAVRTRWAGFVAVTLRATCAFPSTVWLSCPKGCPPRPRLAPITSAALAGRAVVKVEHSACEAVYAEKLDPKTVMAAKRRCAAAHHGRCDEQVDLV